MRLFKKHTDVGASDKAAGWIASSILKLQKKFANVLGEVSVLWRAKQKWIFLYMVCIVFGGLSVLSVVQSFKTKVAIKVSAIKVPRNIHKEITVKITDNEFKAVQHFKRSLDSNSIKKLKVERPGLMDSIEMVEQLYYSQKTKQ